MPKWEKRRLKLKKNHGWTSEPGCHVFVADRGAVRFDILQGWVIEPGEKGSIKLTDKTPPDDDGTLEMSIFYLNDQIDWTNLKVASLVEDIGHKDDPENPVEVLERLDMQTFERDGMTVAWCGKRYIDAETGREACSRILVARKWNIQPLFTYAYWADDPGNLAKAWDILLKTLVLGDYVEDPTQRVF
jgi:hypothetical protein